MVEYGCGSLEDVFLRLCKQKMEEKKPKGGEKSQPLAIKAKPLPIKRQYSDQKDRAMNYKTSAFKTDKFMDRDRMKALLLKNWIRSRRNPLVFVIFFLIPIISLSFCTITIGPKPHHVRVAIYNGESEPRLSKTFLDRIDKSFIEEIYYSDNETAIQSVVKGQNAYAMSFHPNFSDSFDTRILYAVDLDEQEIDESKIKLFADMSDTVVGTYVYDYLLETFQVILRFFE